MYILHLRTKTLSKCINLCESSCVNYKMQPSDQMVGDGVSCTKSNAKLIWPLSAHFITTINFMVRLWESTKIYMN